MITDTINRVLKLSSIALDVRKKTVSSEFWSKMEFRFARKRALFA